MKKLTKSVLAVFLAALMPLCLAPAAGAAPQREPAFYAMAPQSDPAQGTAAITAPGTAEASLYYCTGCGEYHGNDDYDLSGLVVEASGGKLTKTQTVSYDEVTAEDVQKHEAGKIRWYFWLNPDWDAQPNGWKLGSNKAILSVAGWQDTKFVPVREIDGTMYGYFEEEQVFWSETEITIKGVEYVPECWPGREDAIPLALGVPVQVRIDAWDWELEDRCGQWLKFTPEESGLYCFTSKGASSSEWLWTEDGEEHYIPGVRPFARLYDEDGGWLAYSSYTPGHSEHPYNFSIYKQLEKGKTYYLYTSLESNSGGAYTVTVEKSEKKLVAATKKVTIKYGEFLELAPLLQGTTWKPRELEVYSWGYARLAILGYTLFDYGNVLQRVWAYDDDNDYSYIEGFRGANRGAATIRVTAPDGEQAEIEVTVEFSFWNWLQFIFTGGWLIGMPDSWTKMLGGGLMSLGAVPVLLLAVPFLPVLLLGAWFWGQ